jgi:hypothetical protein
MSCTAWNDGLIGRLYGELDGDEAAALAAHLERCDACRETLDEFQRVRAALRDDAQEEHAAPRVLVLQGRPRHGWMALAASVLGAALLAGVGGGVGFAAGRRAGPPSAGRVVAAPSPETETAELDRNEVARRLAKLENEIAAASRRRDERAVSSPELKAEIAKLEKKMNGVRAADLEFVLDQIGASEFRTGTRIGKTNDALRTVALASSPYANEQ